MKNYDEITQNLLMRRNQFQQKQKRQRSLILRVSVMSCVCLCFLFTFIIMNKKEESSNGALIQQNHPSIEKEHTAKNEHKISQESNQYTLVDVVGAIFIDGVEYRQCLEDASNYTLDECLGDARTFEGSYKEFLNDAPSYLYTTKEDQNILIVKLTCNDGSVVLKKRSNE